MLHLSDSRYSCDLVPVRSGPGGVLHTALNPHWARRYYYCGLFRGSITTSASRFVLGCHRLAGLSVYRQALATGMSLK